MVAGSHVVGREKVLAERGDDGIDKFQGNALVLFTIHVPCPCAMCVSKLYGCVCIVTQM